MLARRGASASTFKSSCSTAFRRAPGKHSRPVNHIQARNGRPQRLSVSASIMVKDDNAGVEFPVAQQFWDGDVARCLGAGTRCKKIVFVNVKIYSVAAYVEANRAAKELGVRERGGFFETDDDYCQALLDGAFSKILVVHLVRDVDGEQFTDALNKYLLPRMQLAGQVDKLEEFKRFFLGKTLSNGTEVTMLWNPVGDLEVLLSPPTTGSRGYEQAKPELRIRSQALCQAMFGIFLGTDSVVADAKAAWVKGAKLLLESENVNRATRKSGGG